MQTESREHHSSRLFAARKACLGLLAFVAVFSIFVNLLTLTGPLFMLQVYDRVLTSRSEETLLALIVLVAALYLLMAMLDFARGRLLARIGVKFQILLDEPVIRAAIGNAISPQGQRASSQALKQVETLRNFCASPVLIALVDLPWAPIFLTAIFVFHPVLGWVALAGGAILIALSAMNQMFTKKNVVRHQSENVLAGSFADQAVAGNEIIRAQGMRDAIKNRLIGLRRNAMYESLLAADRTGTFFAISRSFRLFLQSAILCAGAYYVLQQELTPGAMIAASILLGRALSPVDTAIAQWATAQKAQHAWYELNGLLAEIPEEDELIELPRPAAALVVKAVDVTPPDAATDTLKQISFSLKPGQALGVIGRSGSGKSTLAKLLTGIWPPAAGEVRIGGAKLEQYDSDKLGRLVGYLPQQLMLFDGTIAENIARMDIEPDDEDIIAAAKRANAHEMILSLSEGYDTRIFGSNVQLSGGQCQRIALARALYGNPEILILDEPNSALDSDGTNALNMAVREFKNAGKAVVLMTHRPQAIAECDTLLVLENGRIGGLGPKEKVLESMVRNSRDIRESTRPRVVA